MTITIALIPLLTALGSQEHDQDGAYLLCESLLKDAKQYSHMEESELLTRRTDLDKATDLIFFERLYSTSAEELIKVYSLEDGLTQKQVRQKAFDDVKAWESWLLDIGLSMRGITAEHEWTAVYKKCLDGVIANNK